MRILVLSPYPPYPPRSGGALRIYNMVVELAKQHEIWLLTFAPGEAAAHALEPLRAHCHLVTVEGPPRRGLVRRGWSTFASLRPDMALRNRSAAYRRALQQLLQTHSFDIVQAESIEMASYGLLVERFAAAPRPALVLDEFNAEYVLQRRAALATLSSPVRSLKTVAAVPYSLIQWQKLAAYERHLLHRFDHVVVVSEEDRTALLRLHPQADHLSIVPNGVDTAYFARPDPPPPPMPARPPTLVFTGSLDFRPNIDAVTWFAHTVLPLVRARHPGACFVVVGRSPTPAVRALHNDTTIRVHGDVEDVRPFIAHAAVYIVPIRMGGGIRLKLLEALAMQAPVVSTTMGAAGVAGLRNEDHLLLADRPEPFASAVLRLLDNPTLGEEIGQAGRQLVSERYDWRVLVPRLDPVYARLRGET
jgi:sugar transferase (PEP-CTERM/EpsH1 system associated)